MERYIRWFLTSIVIGSLLGVVILLSSCSYGTFYATGSYANQNNDNHKTDNCAVPKG